MPTTDKSPINFRELLKKYVQLIAEEEGVIYGTAMFLSPNFNAEEIAMIEVLADEPLIRKS